MAEPLNLRHLLRSVCVACVGVNIQCHARIRVTHQVLKIFNVHAVVCIVRAEGVPEHMRGDVRQRAVWMKLLVLLHCPAHLVFDV